jgi:hypothetical protein
MPDVPFDIGMPDIGMPDGPPCMDPFDPWVNPDGPPPCDAGLD